MPRDSAKVNEVDYDGRVPPRSSIDRYQPEVQLGSAGLVETYRVRVRDADGLAAVKIVLSDRAEASITELVTRRFLAAGLRARQSALPGIARVLEVSDEPEIAYVATEWVAGIDLARLLQLARQGREPALDPVVSGLLCAQVARCLSAAHELESPLFHLGLSPGNVIVTPAAKVMVLDFGFSAALRGVASCSVEKWRFVSPELLGCDAAALSAEASRAADLYSLGALLYFLLTGRWREEAATLAALAEQVWEPVPEVPGVPAKLLSAVRALTSPDASQRPKSTEAVVDWLSGGLDTARARHDYLVNALNAVLVEPSAEEQKSSHSPKRAAKSDAAFRRNATALFKAASHAKGTTARTAMPKARRWLTLLSVGTLLACAMGVGIVEVRRVSRDQAQSSTAKSARGSVPKAQLNGPSVLEARLAADPELTPTGATEAEPEQTPSRVPNHLILETHPSQADVWVDGVLKGKTPVDLMVGPGGHRVVAIKPGYRMLRAVFDTTLGEYARRELQRADFRNFGDAFLDVQCPNANKYPVVLDDEETGLLCPVSRLPVASGKHSIGIFVPIRKANMTVEVAIPPGRQPMRVMLKD